MTDEEFLQFATHANRTDAIYRFWRRYLAKYHPEVLEKIAVEALTAEEITQKAQKMLPEEYSGPDGGYHKKV